MVKRLDTVTAKLRDVEEMLSHDRGLLCEIARAIEAPDAPDGSVPIEQLPKLCGALYECAGHKAANTEELIKWLLKFSEGLQTATATELQAWLVEARKVMGKGT